MRSRGTRRSRAGRAGQLPASSAACSRQCGAEGPGCAPPPVRLPAFFYLVRDSCSIALTMPLQHVRGFLVFVRAVCVRSFEMALPKMYPIRISSFFFLLSRHFGDFFLLIIQPQAQHVSKFSSAGLLALLLQLSIFAFFPMTCCSVWQLRVTILRVLPYKCL